MSGRQDPRNPVVKNSSGQFTEVGYLTSGTPMPVNVIAGGAGGGLTQNQVRDSATNWADVGYVAGGGTPMPVNLVAGVLTGANPSDGTLTQLGTLYYLYGLDHGTVAISGGTLTGSNPSAGTLDTLTRIGTLPVLGTLGTLAYLSNVGTAYYLNSAKELGTLDHLLGGTVDYVNIVTQIGTLQGIVGGTVEIKGGTLSGVNPSAGTLDKLTQIGTLPTLGTLGTLSYLGNLGTVYYVNSVKELGTLDHLIGGTVDYLSNLGTVYHVFGLDHGTVAVSGGTLTGSNPSAGTLDKLTQIGTLPTLGTLGTLYYLAGLGGGTVAISGGTLTGSNPSAGTLDKLTQIGTLPTLGTMGTLWYAANLGTVYQVYGLDHGTVAVSGGTLTGSNPSAGTLDKLTQIGTLPTLGTLGTLNYLSNVGTVYWVSGLDHGTVAISGGTLTGSNPNAGTLDILTQIGTLPTQGTMGTLYFLRGFGLGTVRVDSGTIGISAGTVYADARLNVVDAAGVWEKVGLGTYRMVPIQGTVSAGTVQVQGTVGISAGTVIPAGLGTVRVDLGTIGVSMGTLQGVTTVTTVTNVTNLPTLGTMGTLFYQNALGTVFQVFGLDHGTVAISGGTLTGSNPSAGTLDKLTQIGTLPTLGTLGTLSYLSNIGTVYWVGGLDHGTVAISGGTLTGSNPSAGTLDKLTQIGTLPTLGTLGTLNYLSNIGTVYYLSGLDHGTVAISGGTLTGSNPSAGTLDKLTQIGTLPTLGTMGTLFYLYGFGLGTVRVDSGTIAISGGTLTGSNPSAGTLDTLTKIGTLPTLGTLGTLYYLSGFGLGTVRVDMGTIGVSAGTVIPAGLGTVRVDLGTIGINMGTLQTVTQVGTLPTLGTMGTLYYLPNVGTLSYQSNLGTVYYQNNLGTVYALGSANTYAKHDLHVYDSVGTMCTATTGQGSLVQTASKIVKVHHYHAQADGTFGFHFADTKPNGGTVDQGWYFLQREGVTTAFIPYPGYLFKTTTAGSALCVGTWPSIPCNGTLRLHVVYTDDDTS